MARPMWPVVIWLTILVAGCTLERRPDLEPENGGGRGVVAGAASPSTVDSVRAVLSAFHEALALGDGARVAALTTPGAVLVDQEEGIRWQRAADSNPALPPPLSSRRDGLGWTVVDSDFSLLGETTGILVTEYRARVEGEAVPWSAVESVIVLREEAGWRIRYLHQSRGPQAGPEGL